MTVRLPTITVEQRQALQNALDHFGEILPGCGLTVASDSEILFDGRSGKFDALEADGIGRAAAKEDVLWFASTTKLITSVGVCPSSAVSLCILKHLPPAYLQLVDQGILNLDSDLSELYAPLKEATRRVFRGVDEQGQSKWEPAATSVTLRMLLNQTSGFGMEFLEGVTGWKKYSGKGTGFVNSCKVVRQAWISLPDLPLTIRYQDNLIHTPIVEQPGVQFQYGNSAE
jgi:hypothetical protein